MNCNLCQVWFHIACVDISDEAYQMLESMKGSVWLCEASDDNFGDLQKKLDSMSNENVVLRARLNDLKELPCMVKSLQSQVESIAKDLDLMLNGTDGSDTPAMGKKLAPVLTHSIGLQFLAKTANPRHTSQPLPSCRGSPSLVIPPTRDGKACQSYHPPYMEKGQQTW